MDTVAAIAARYGATVAPGVTVQRLPTGASSRPYPVWNPAKNMLEVPDWKEEAERAKRAGIRRAHAGWKRGRAQDAELMARIIAMHAQGMRPPAIGAATGLSADQVYRLLRGAGHSVERLNQGPSPATLQRAAEVRRLAAEGKTRAEVVQALGFKNSSALAMFCRRSVRGVTFGAAVRAARIGGPKARGRDMGAAWESYRAEQHARVQELIAGGATEAEIGKALGIKSDRHLRRVIRAVAPDYVFAVVERFPDQAERDARIRDLIGRMSTRDVAAKLGLTQGQVAASVRRSCAAGLIGAEVDAVRATRRRRVAADTIAARDARVLGLIRDMSYAEVARKLGLRITQVKASVIRLRLKGDLPPSGVERMPMRPGSMNGAAPKKPERTAAILHRHGLGQTVDQIARETGAPRRAVITALQRAGETPRIARLVPKADRLAALPGLVAEGLTARQIGERWGKSEAYVYKLASDAKISLGRNARPHNDGTVSFRVAARRELVRGLYVQGFTHPQMCELLQISQATLSGDIKALGIAGTSPNALANRAAQGAERRAA